MNIRRLGYYYINPQNLRITKAKPKNRSYRKIHKQPSPKSSYTGAQLNTAWKNALHKLGLV